MDVAKLFSSNLSRLLELFVSRDRGLLRCDSIESHLATEINSSWLQEIEFLLNDPDITTATEKFCEYIIKNYSFADVIESSIKRVIWHSLMPSLLDLEVKYIDHKFQNGIIRYLIDRSTAGEKYTLNNLTEMGVEIQQCVLEY